MGAIELEKERFIQWLSLDVIADAVFDELEDSCDNPEFEPVAHPTLEDAQAVWLDVLEHSLPDGIRMTVERLIEKRVNA